MENNISSYLAVASGIDSARAEALMPILKERKRGLASNAETWAELKVVLDRIKTKMGQAEREHKEMWDAVKDRNKDGFDILIDTFERSAADIAGEWVRLAALVKIAIDDPELPAEPTEEEQLAEARARLDAVLQKQIDIEDVLEASKGEVHSDLARELSRLQTEEVSLRVRLNDTGAVLGKESAAEDTEA